MARRKKRQSRTTNAVRAKRFKEAQALREIRPVEPAGTRIDGSPIAEPGRAYVMWAGMVYHPAWCMAVGTAWDAGPDRVVVIDQSTVGKRRPCQTCEQPLQP